MGYASDKNEEETEIQTRSRIVHNGLQDRSNCLVLKIDTRLSAANEMSPFGFHFEFDKKKYKERQKALRKEKIFKWLALIAVYHHKFGIRHLLLLLLLAVYIFAGAAIFYELESPNEISSLESTINQMNNIISTTVTDIDDITAATTGSVRDEKLKRLLKKYYKRMLTAEDRFDGSAWHKAENLDMHLTWYYSSSTFYCITLFTTIGYGTISCQTTAGRIVTCIYASIGIPLMLVVLGDLGECIQKLFTTIYAFFLTRYRKWSEKKDPEEEELVLPIWIALSLVGIYFTGCAMFIWLFDKEEGNLPGMEFADAFYFTFISLTTIGLGDVMPYNIQYSPILSFAFFLGLALVSIVNTSIYAKCYDGFFNMIEAMEMFLERVHRSQSTQHGHKVLQDLEPAFRLLACSFPDVDNYRKEMIKAMNTAKHKFVKRTISYAGEVKESKAKVEKSRRRAPTLGAFGGRPLEPYRPRHASASVNDNHHQHERESNFSNNDHPIAVTASSSATTVTVTDETDHELYADGPPNTPMFSFPERFFIESDI